jgi:S1-C subfamily serine protease
MSLSPLRPGRALARRVLAALPLLASPASLASAQSSVTPIVDGAADAVVSVSVRFLADAARPNVPPHAVRVQRPGSGVLVDVSGLVLTNAHLVAEVPDGAPQANQEFWPVVSLANGRTHQVEVLARDERADLALLRIVGGGEQAFSALPIAPPGSGAPGARVVALGRPDPDSAHVFAGALARASGPVRLRDALLDADEVLISDARFHDLLDGAPLLDARGRVLGLHNSSHISVLPPGFSTPPGEEPPKSVDYAVIVSAAAIERALGRHLEGREPPRAPLPEGAGDEAPGAVSAIAPSVVSVWTGAGEHPAASAPGDPHGLRVAAGLGSGVVVDARGLVVTCAALFEDGGTTASVRLASGDVHAASALKIDREHDVALLRVALPEDAVLPAATLGDSRETLEGQFVAVVGRPFGSALTLSVGVLSARERDGLLQLASWVHRGHWGGALVDRAGHLCGIAVHGPEAARVTEESYLGFAVPLAAALEALGDAWRAEAGEASLPETHATPASELRNGVARVVEVTHGSLINVIVSAGVAPQAPGGFNPLAGAPQLEFRLLSQGSGVIIDESGLAISNWHVVEAALDVDGRQRDDFKIEVTLPGDRRYEVRVLSTSRDDDLSLLRLILPPGETVAPVAFGDSDAVRLGEPVVAIGNPLGLSDSVSAGVVSCLSSPANIRGRYHTYPGMLMTDAPINPGNSGGALLDLQGRLVGINSAGSVGMGLAIPVNKAREVFSDKLLSAENLRSSYLGVQVAETERRVLVTAVNAHGPAARAGIEPGDRLVRIGEQAIETAVHYAQAQLGARPGVALPFVVERGGEQRTLEVEPLSFTAWNLFRQTGIQVEELDYAAESEVVRAAGRALHRAYVGDPRAEPKQLMTGALRVTDVAPLDDAPLDVRPGDLLLGMTTVTRGAQFDTEELVRFDGLGALRDAVAPLATIEGNLRRCWILRDGEMHQVNVLMRRPPR